MSWNKQIDYNEISTNFIQLTYEFTTPIQIWPVFAISVSEDDWILKIFILNIDLTEFVSNK